MCSSLKVFKIILLYLTKEHFWFQTVSMPYVGIKEEAFKATLNMRNLYITILTYPLWLMYVLCIPIYLEITINVITTVYKSGDKHTACLPINLTFCSIP